MKENRILVVGAGFAGATISRVLAENSYKVVVIEKRNHIGGNCYTRKEEDIDVHVYGPHIFHTNNDRVWNWVNRFSKFNVVELC